MLNKLKKYHRDFEISRNEFNEIKDWYLCKNEKITELPYYYSYEDITIVIFIEEGITEVERSFSETQTHMDTHRPSLFDNLKTIRSYYGF